MSGLDKYFDSFFGWLVDNINAANCLEDFYLLLDRAIIESIIAQHTTGFDLHSQDKGRLFNLLDLILQESPTDPREIDKKSDEILKLKIFKGAESRQQISTVITLAKRARHMLTQKVKDYLTNYDGLVEAELSLTPRDIKQLANAYIYSVVSVYDGFLEEGKKPRDHQQAFRQRLNLELAKTIEKEATKQAQKNTPKIKP